MSIMYGHVNRAHVFFSVWAGIEDKLGRIVLRKQTLTHARMTRIWDVFIWVLITCVLNYHVTTNAFNL